MRTAQKYAPILGVVFTMLQFYGNQPIAALRPYIEQTKKLGVPVFNNYARENKTLFGRLLRMAFP